MKKRFLFLDPSQPSNMQKNKNEKGAALIFVVIISLVLSIIFIELFPLLTSSKARNVEQRLTASYAQQAAYAGLAMSKSAIHNSTYRKGTAATAWYYWNSDPSSNGLSNLSSIELEGKRIDYNTKAMKLNGQYAGFSTYQQIIGVDWSGGNYIAWISHGDFTVDIVSNVLKVTNNIAPILWNDFDLLTLIGATATNNIIATSKNAVTNADTAVLDAGEENTTIDYLLMYVESSGYAPLLYNGHGDVDASGKITNDGTTSLAVNQYLDTTVNSRFFQYDQIDDPTDAEGIYSYKANHFEVGDILYNAFEGKTFTLTGGFAQNTTSTISNTGFTANTNIKYAILDNNGPTSPEIVKICALYSLTNDGKMTLLDQKIYYIN